MFAVQAVAALAVGVPYPGAVFGAPALYGPTPLEVEGVRFVRADSSVLRLVNDKGYIVKEFSPDAASKQVQDWLAGSSLPSGYVAPDPRKTLTPLPSVDGPLWWQDVVGIGIRFALQKPTSPRVGERGLLLLFLSSYGPADHLYGERVREAATKAKQHSISVMAVFSGKRESNVTIARYAAIHSFEFDCAIDHGNAYADAFRATRTPEVFLLDNALRVVYTGAIDESTYGGETARPYLLNALDDLAGGRDQRTPHTRVFGTPIDR